MKLYLILSLVAFAYADQCHFGESGSKPQSLVICKTLTEEALGKNVKLGGKPGPFDNVIDFELTNFTGKLDANTLQMFPNLQRLVIQDSNFPKINSQVFDKTKKLKKLSIRNNVATTIEVGSFKDLKSLEELNINNKLPKLTKDFFLGLDKLKKLTLRKTKIAEIDENALDILKDLETLEIYDNTFPLIKPNTFLPLKELKKLSILDNPSLKTFPLDLLKEQKKLELLGLPSEILSKIDLSALKKQLPNLKKIEVKVEDKKKFETYFKKAQEQNVVVNYIASTKIYEAAPPPTKKLQTSLINKLLEGDSSFSSHCRSRDQKFNSVKEKVVIFCDISALRKVQTPPLTQRYELLSRECLHLDQTLERQQQELDRMAKMFDESWEEQLWRLRVEQEVFSCQRADVNTLRNELKHLTQVATQLEPYIRSLTPSQQFQAAQSEKSGNQEAEHLASLLQHIGILQHSEAALGKIPRSRSRVLGQLLEKVKPNIQERESSKSAGSGDKPLATPQKPKKPLLGSTQQMSIDRLEAHIKEKFHDIMCRRQSSAQPTSKSDTELKEEKMGAKQRIMYKKIGKSCDKINACNKTESEGKKSRSEGEYQRILDATSQNVKALVHESKSSPSSPKCKNKMKMQQRTKKPKVYPYSDGEDNVFYSMNDSADSLSTSSRRSSFEGLDKTFVVV